MLCEGSLTAALIFFFFILIVNKLLGESAYSLNLFAVWFVTFLDFVHYKFFISFIPIFESSLSGHSIFFINKRLFKLNLFVAHIGARVKWPRVLEDIDEKPVEISFRFNFLEPSSVNCLKLLIFDIFEK